MANIIDKIAQIRSAILGKDVRESIASGIEDINQEVVNTTTKQSALDATFQGLIINAGSSNAEVVAARGGEVSLPAKLGKIDSQLADIPSQINLAVSPKADISYVDGQIQNMNSIVQGFYPTINALTSAVPSGNANNYVVTGNIAEVASLTISAIPTSSGNITVTLNGVTKTIAVDSSTDTTTSAVATKIRNTAFTGWTTGGTDSIVTFTATIGGAKSDAVFSGGSTGVTGIITTTTQGVDADNHIYRWNGSAWVSTGFLFNSTGIANKSIRPIQLDRQYAYAKAGKNKFDKSTVTNGYYVNGDTGVIMTNASYFLSDYIPVEAGSTYYLNNTFQFAAIYDANFNFMRGSNVSTFEPIIQTGEAYMRVSNSISYVGTGLLERDIKTGVYEEYKQVPYDYAEKSVDLKHITDTLKQYIDSKQSTVSFPVIIVDKNGKGDYTTISDAVANCGSTLASKIPVTIFVMPGIYDETVDIRGKYISLIGIDKSQCILKNTSGDYYKPPLWATSNFYVANMTFISNEENMADPAPPLKNYGVHIEYDPTYPHTGGTGEFYNCDIISEHNASAVGCGLHTDIEIIFNNCNIKSIMDGCTVPALFAHNYLYAGATGQKLTVKNCSLETDHLAVYRFDDANHDTGGGMDNIDTEFTFINNCGWSTKNGKTNVITGDTTPQGSGKFGYIKLDAKSYGNNVAELNA